MSPGEAELDHDSMMCRTRPSPIHLAGALDQPDSGTVSLGGQSYAALDDKGRAQIRRSKIGLVFQQFNLITSLDVGANLRFQARLAGVEDPAWTAEIAQRLDLHSRLSQMPETLSGGQQQRVALARAMLKKGSIYLLDEPTTGYVHSKDSWSMQQ